MFDAVFDAFFRGGRLRVHRACRNARRGRGRDPSTARGTARGSWRRSSRGRAPACTRAPLDTPEACAGSVPAAERDRAALRRDRRGAPRGAARSAARVAPSGRDARAGSTCRGCCTPRTGRAARSWSSPGARRPARARRVLAVDRRLRLAPRAHARTCCALRTRWWWARTARRRSRSAPGSRASRAALDTPPTSTAALARRVRRPCSTPTVGRGSESLCQELLADSRFVALARGALRSSCSRMGWSAATQRRWPARCGGWRASGTGSYGGRRSPVTRRTGP